MVFDRFKKSRSGPEVFKNIFQKQFDPNLVIESGPRSDLPFPRKTSLPGGLDHPV